MKNYCKVCNESTTNGTNFCSKGCGRVHRRKHAKIYKKLAKKIGDDPLLNQGITGRGVFDCDGNK